jgi:2-polyprenyl-3-methyl-5-hydroxy-6-metoxy-1,4-benzoquinol methylase
MRQEDTMSIDQQTNPYDATYYRVGCGVPYERNEHWLTFFGKIADAIVREINPGSVLDAGCAMGFLVEALRQRGVEAYGVDISD